MCVPVSVQTYLHAVLMLQGIIMPAKTGLSLSLFTLMNDTLNNGTSMPLQLKPVGAPVLPAALTLEGCFGTDLQSHAAAACAWKNCHSRHSCPFTLILAAMESSSQCLHLMVSAELPLQCTQQVQM